MFLHLNNDYNRYCLNSKEKSLGFNRNRYNIVTTEKLLNPTNTSNHAQTPLLDCNVLIVVSCTTTFLVVKFFKKAYNWKYFKCLTYFMLFVCTQYVISFELEKPLNVLRFASNCLLYVGLSNYLAKYQTQPCDIINTYQCM